MTKCMVPRRVIARVSPTILLTILLLTCPRPATGQDEDIYKEKVVVKTISGIRFQVPEDMPIVKRNNTLMALPIEEYVSWKCTELKETQKKMGERVEANEQNVADLQKRAAESDAHIKEIDEDLVKTKAELKETQERFRDTEERLRETEAMVRSLSNWLSDTSKIVSEMKETQGNLEKVTKRLKVVEKEIDQQIWTQKNK